MTKLLWTSDSPLYPTGYAQVTRNLLNRFRKAGIETHCLGFLTTGATINHGKVGNDYLDFPIYQCLFPNEYYGNQGSILYWNNIIKPDIQAFLCDSFMIKLMVDLRYEKKDAKINEFRNIDRIVGKKLFYFPFDSHEVYTEAEEVIKAMDVLVAMSRSGQKILKKDMGLDSHHIPHGVDTNIFRPLAKNDIDFMKKQNNWEGKFIVGCIARNSGRKMLTRLIDAFKIFQEGKDDVLLVFHTHPKDSAGNDLSDWGNKLGLKKKIIYSGLPSPFVGVPEDQVNMMYNCMDIHVLPTSGEGFGLPIIESMAVGIPNICTDFTTARELLTGHGEVAKVITTLAGEKNSQRALVDVEDLAKKMEKLYQNKKLRERYSRDGRRFVLENYTWEKVVRGWLELFEFGEVREKFI